MVFNFKQFMFDKSLRQSDLAQILGESQSVISYFVNGKRAPMDRHLNMLEKEFGSDVISQYLIDTDKYRDIVGQSVPATIIPAEVVEEIKEEVAQAESVPMLPRDVSIATDVNIRNYIVENGDELRRINPSQMLHEANPDIAERVLQPSMLPTFAPGDTIFIRFIKDKAKLIDGKIYHFDLKALPTMIRMVKIEGEKIRLIATNSNFGDMVVDRTDIVSVAEIVGLLRMTFVDFYSDLERERKQKDEQITEMISSHTAQVDNLIKQIAKFGEREDRLIDMLEKKL